MQSFLQYRRFGRHVKAQYERDQEKARALGQHGENAQSSDGVRVASFPSTGSSRTSVDLSPEDTRDPEKAEHSGHHEKDEGDIEPAAVIPPFTLEDATPTHNQDEIDELSQARTLTRGKSYGTAMGVALTGINVRDRTTKEGRGKGKVFVVGYEGEKDMLDPHNWSFVTRIGAT